MKAAPNSEALLRATRARKTAEAIALLKAGANPNSRDANGRTVLMYAAAADLRPVIDLLIRKGANLNAADPEGETPLMYAARSDHFAGMARLIAAGARCDRANRDGMSPLMYIGGVPSLLPLQAFLKVGGSPNAAEKYGFTLLQLSINHVHTPFDDAFEAELKQDPEARRMLAQEERERYVITFAKVKLLLDRGANPNKADPSGIVAWHYAQHVRVPAGQKPLTTLLREHGAKKPAPSMAAAICFEDLGELKRALAAGADPNQPAWMGQLPIVDVVGKMNSRTWLQALLARGAKTNVRNAAGLTPLHIATNLDEERLEVVQLLLKSGADPNTKDRNGNTPLIHTLSIGHSNVVRLLLESGANANERDPEGRTALMFAKDAKTAKLLLDHGADARAVDHYGHTVLERAESANDSELVQVIKDAGAMM